MCVLASAHASASVSSSKRNDNESTDTSKGAGKKREGAQKRVRENAKLKYSAPSEEKIKQAWFSSISPKKEKGREKKTNIEGRPQISERKRERETAQGQENIKDRERKS